MAVAAPAGKIYKYMLPKWLDEFGLYSIHVPSVRTGLGRPRFHKKGNAHAYDMDELGRCTCGLMHAGRYHEGCRHDQMRRAILLYFNCPLCGPCDTPLSTHFGLQVQRNGDTAVVCKDCTERLRQAGFPGVQMTSEHEAWLGRPLEVLEQIVVRRMLGEEDA